MSGGGATIDKVKGFRMRTPRFAMLVALVVVASPVRGLTPAMAAPAESGPQSLAWATHADMPTPRYSAGAAAWHDKIYVVGGDNYTNTPLTVLEEYTPAANQWATRAPMPTGRWRLGLVAAPNGRLYAIGGHTVAGYTGVVEEYDPVTNTWAPRASMPTPRDDFGITLAGDGKIYVVGGHNASGDLPTVEAYDPESNTWTARSSMLTPRSRLGLAAAVNGKLYAVGGSVQYRVEEYDLVADAWVSRADMPTGRYALGLAATATSQLYAVGGEAGSGSLATVEAYNPLWNAWSAQTPMPTPRHDVSAVATEAGRLYVIGGWSGGPSSVVESAAVEAAAETVTVPFVNGTAGVMTTHAYTGTVAVTVAGVGQASGTQLSDAFYLFTDAAGQPITPWHPAAGTLWVNGAPADEALPAVPPYAASHVYTFTLAAPGGPLNFAIGDPHPEDNSGSLTITLVPLQSPGGCLDLPSTIYPKVLVVTYNPWLSTLGKSLFEHETNFDPWATSQQIRQDFCETSGGFVNIQLVGRIDRTEFPLEADGLRLTEGEYLQLRAQGQNYAQAHGGAHIDIRHAIEDGGLHLKIGNHEVDEIWLFLSWTYGFYEAYMGGPGAFSINGPTFPSDSGRAFAVMGFETAVGVPNSLHSVGHRVESTLDRAFGYFASHLDTPWARFRKNPSYAAEWLPGVPMGIGDIHHPPNTNQDYDYTNPAVATSSADDWLNYPSLTGQTQRVTAQTWGNSDHGYYRWWYGHLPRAAGVSPRADSAPDEFRQNNWWKYIFLFNQYPELVGAENVDGTHKTFLPSIAKSQ
jgi:N-acetylneuraminic acid mutarotase